MKTIVHPEDRLRLLLEHKNRKMAVSAHAYVRGSTRRFYEWLNQSDHAEIPAGPPVWICGDCHIGNLGPVGSGGGALAVQIRDLDQTVIGNPAHDLIRLGLSLAMAARSSDLPGVVTALMMEKMVDGYTSAFLLAAPDDADDVPVPNIVAGAMHAAARRSWNILLMSGSRARRFFLSVRDSGPCHKTSGRRWKNSFPMRKFVASQPLCVNLAIQTISV